MPDAAPFNPSLYVADTGTAKGRGVFAAKGFKADEIVEVCPVVIIRCHTNVMPPELRTLVFDWAVLANIPDSNALALGFGSLYNHSNPANMRYRAGPSGQSLLFIAARDIAVGEELTVNYDAIGGGPEWHDNNWFERMGIQPIQPLNPEN